MTDEELRKTLDQFKKDLDWTDTRLFLVFLLVVVTAYLTMFSYGCGMLGVKSRAEWRDEAQERSTEFLEERFERLEERFNRRVAEGR